MALQLAITNNKGVTANYHRITSATQTYDRSPIGIHIILTGYISRAYRDKEITAYVNSNFLPSLAVSNTPIFLPFVEGETFKLGALYTRIKAEITEFGSSTDV